MKEKIASNQSNATAIGSFRNVVDVKNILPKMLYDNIFEAIPNNLDARKLITVSSQKIFLNNGAFGHAYDAVRKLSLMLREFSEEEPEIFYDQVCLSLINHTYEVLEEFFGTENVLLVPNCTLGMRCIAELLIRDQQLTDVACLEPIYGATSKLLQYYESEDFLTSLIRISAGENPLVEEDADEIMSALVKAYNKTPFRILFPIRNTKTCGIIHFKDCAPLPPAITIGWEAGYKKRHDIKRIRAQFAWQGMMDSYISYITLAKAVKIFSKYGQEQFFQTSQLLRRGLADHLNVLPMLPVGKDRVMNIFELECSSLVSMPDINSIQNALQDYGILVSVKKVGKDCGDASVDDQNGVRSTIKRTIGDGEPQDTGGAVCNIRSRPLYYLRLSPWSFNTDADFKALANVFTNNLPLSTTTSAGLRQQFLYIYELYEKLFTTLKTKAFFVRAERLRHHLIFYYGHTAVFYINKLVASGYLNPSHRFDPRLESSMSVGVDEMSWDDILEENYDWSGMNDDELQEYLEKVKEYRKWVKKLVLNQIDENPIVNPISQGSLAWVLIMAIEHEKVHMETTAVIISQVPIELIKTKHNFNFPTYWQGKQFMTPLMQSCNKTSVQPPVNKLVPISGGTVLLGKDHLESDLYGWDNEYGRERKELVDFEASQMLVSNSEFMEFVKAGGYKDVGERWWSNEGWKYVTDLKVTGPRFWIKDHTHYRAMLEEIPMPWELPVEVNNLEAQAFCTWKSEQLGKRVRLISQEESVHMRMLAADESANLNLNKYASPTPVNMYGGMINERKVYDISGNIWRHSVSVLTTMDGFKTDPLYTDYTLPFIDGFHNLILGGSWISIGNSANIGARLGFRRHFYQYAGIRYVSSDNTYHDSFMGKEMVINENITAIRS